MDTLDGAALRSLRRSMGITRAQLAGMLAYTPRTIRAWENGERRIRDRQRAQVADALARVEIERQQTLRTLDTLITRWAV